MSKKKRNFTALCAENNKTGSHNENNQDIYKRNNTKSYAMRKTFLLTLLLTLCGLSTAWAQAPVATAEKAITELLNRIGGNGAADKFEIVIDANLAENGKDVFVITAQNSKPCIKGNTQLSVATGINWYLNHYAHINLTWNNLTTDLSQVTLPVPASEEKHVCNTTYRYDFNTCTFSYSMAFWTWDRWQKEIDWMALHGINAPLNLVGLDVVTRKFLRELGVSEDDINAYIAGPGFIAWFAMNNLEGWGGTINSSSTGVQMNGNPDWWYTRQEQLCRNMLQRMRELGMQPVIPGFSGQVPNCIVNYTIDGFSSGDVVNNGTWAGGYTRPDILKPNTTSYRTFAAVYYKHLHEVMGVSELYSMDPFHEGSLPSGVTNETCYPNIMVELDNYYNGVSQEDKAKNNVDEQPKWIIQYWQDVPQSGAFSAMSGYGDRFIGLDLFSDNIYAGNAAKWRDTGDACYFKGRPYIYCMLHNFGGRSGMHGRLETTMDGYFQALANNNNCQGIGATPEGTETNPILYDMLFELPWMDPATRPSADKWLEDYAYSRYGINPAEQGNANALEALKNLKKSVWDCKVNQQGTSEAVILARPNWTVGSVSKWSTAAIYWDTQDVLQAADQLFSVKDQVTAKGGQDGIANYNYDFIDVVRQAMVDYAAELLPLINAARGDDAEYTRLYQLYLQLMLDLDEMLSYDENFKLERWTSLARNIADEVTGTTENDRNWLEWNARTQVTVWAYNDNDLHDYSNRCWAGLIKDFHYKRWEKFFTTKGGSFDGGWFNGFEYPWTVDFNETYDLAGDYSQIVIPNDMTATEKAAETFGKYFGRVKGATKNYIFPMGVARKATKSDVVPEVYRGQTVDLPLEIGKSVTITSVWVDLNNDGAKGNGETLTATDNQVAIPADATIGKTTAQVVYSDGTDITFNLALIEDITEARTVTAIAGANGSVAIEGTNELFVTNTEAVKMTATANTGYNFENWTDGEDNVVSNDNPFVYYGKEAATFTANFIQDKWGVPNMTGSGLNEAISNNQYVSKIDFAYRNREAETIYDASTTAPTSLFTTIPQIINVPQGASFTISWTDNGSQNLTKCFLSAYMDFDGDGNFEEEGELVKVVGTRDADNASVRSGSFQVVLPYDAPVGITHLRMRFDSAWGNQYNSSTGAFNSKGELNRMCYEVVINITEKSDKAATINVETNSTDWGTVEVWTDETPDGSTGTTWEVSANIPMYLRATKASEDVEFLGWYDHYGRLLTNELEYSMLAREDATYTARFRKALDIDGWQFEYRTEPGTQVTNKLTNGVKPEAGKTYYIYAPTRPTNDGEYVNRYLYNNNGTLALSTTESTAASYLWVCGIEDGKYTFQNVADPVKYLMHKGLSNSPYGFELGTGDTKYEGITMQSIPGNGETRNLFFVINDDGSDFNQSTRTHDQSTEDYTTDFVFTEVSTPDVVILTSVRQSGDHDLDIPETVEILGEQCKVVGFDNNLFNNNKDLWSISLPSTIETLSNNVLFRTSVKGENTPTSSGDTNPDNKVQVIDLDFTLKNSEAWTIRATYKSDGVSTFNQWGSPLLYPNGNGTGTELFFLSNINGWSSCWHVRSPFSGLGNDYFKNLTNTKIATFTALLENKGTGKAVITVTNSEGQSQTSSEVAFSYDNISAFSAKLPKGLDITDFEVLSDVEPDPFEGCTNLLDITIANGGCNGGYTVDGREFKNASGVVLHTLADEDEDKADALRALDELIDNTEALMDVIATSINPVEVAPKYKNLVGITDEEAAEVYDGLVNALNLYNNGGTAAELQAAYDVLEPLYAALNAKKDKVLNGVYHINHDGVDLFVAYAEANALKDLTGYENPGFRLFDAKVDNTGTEDTSGDTSDAHKELQENAIAAKVAADELFTIVPNSDASGYTISAQGLYMRTTSVYSQWCIQAFDTVKANAGVYLVEASNVEDLYKLKSNKDDTQYINDWGPVFGNDQENKPNLSTFSFTPATNYPLTITPAGMATLCLPFNVQIPEGMTAYDLVEEDIDGDAEDGNDDGIHICTLQSIAEEGAILKAGTPVIVAATSGNYNLPITMEDNGAITSLTGSLLCGNYMSQPLVQGDTKKKFIFTSKNDVVGFYIMNDEGTIAANKCWMEWTVPAGANVRSLVIRFGNTTDIENVAVAPEHPAQPVIYNLAGQRLEAPQRGINIINGRKIVVK